MNRSERQIGDFLHLLALRAHPRVRFNAIGRGPARFKAMVQWQRRVSAEQRRLIDEDICVNLSASKREAQNDAVA